MVGTGRFELPRFGFASRPSQALLGNPLWQIPRLGCFVDRPRRLLLGEGFQWRLNGRDGQI